MENQGTSKERVGQCQICEQPAHGIHFGVLSCRACAAFFRRTVVFTRQYSCRKGDSKCEIEKSSRIICRRCRYEKCIRIGMTQDNVQYNRDKMVGNKPSTSKSFYDKEEELPTDILPNPQKTLRFESMTIPVVRAPLDNILKKLENFFTTYNPDSIIPDIWSQPPLTRMLLGLSKYRQYQATTIEELTFIREINIKEAKNNWEDRMLQVAEWFMFCKEFVELSCKQKLIIFQDRWKAFLRLERCLMSTEFFGPKVLEDKIILFGGNCAAYIKEVKVDLSSISDYDSNYIKSFFEPIIDNVFEKVLTPLVQLQLCPHEAVYLLCQVTFCIEGLDICYETIDAFINFRDRVSDDLHNYYTSVGLSNYAHRLMEILSICQSMESVQTQREQVMELIRIFDFMKLDGPPQLFKPAKLA